MARTTTAAVLLLAAPSAAQYVDPYPAYAGENLILEGGSFEVGRDGFSVGRRMYESTNPDAHFAPLEWDGRPRYAVHGERSLRLVNRHEDYVRVDFHWMRLEPGQRYRVSFWAKAEKAAGQPAGEAMLLTAKVSGQNVPAVHQQAFALTEEWTRYVTEAFEPPAGLLDDLAYLRLWTGPWKSSIAKDSARRLEGTIWVDGVQVAGARVRDYEYPPDEPVELGAWTEDAAGPRTGNLFHDGDGHVRARVRLFSDDWSGRARVDFALRGPSGALLHEGAGDELEVRAGAGVETELVLRSSPMLPSPASVGGSTAASAHTAGEADLLEGRLGVFKIDLVARDARTDRRLGSEELLLAVIRPDTDGPDLGSPFGVHLHFLHEGSKNGFPANDPHEHVLESTVDPDYLFGAVSDAGFEWVRNFSFASWAAVQPRREAWVFDDTILERCEAHGLQLMPILGWISPTWADTGVAGAPIVDWQAPRNLVDARAWQRFVHAVADRYKGRIPVYEIGNEPYFYYGVGQYHDTFLAPAKAAVDQLVGAVAFLAGPGGGIVSYTPEDHPPGNFIDQLFDPRTWRGGEELTFLTEHFYVKKDPPFEDGFHGASTGLVERLDAYQSAYVGPEGPGLNTVAGVWDSESGQVAPTLRTDTRLYAKDFRSPPSFPAGFLDSMSGSFELANLVAAYHVRTYALELAHGAQRFFVHTTRFGMGSPVTVGSQALLEWDDTPTHSFAALAAMAGQLQGVTPATNVHRVEGGNQPGTASVYAMTFDLADRPVAVVWDFVEDGIFATLTLGLDPSGLAAFDLYGNPFELAPAPGGGALLPLSNLPVYLEGEDGAVDFAALTEAIDDATTASIGGVD